LVGAVRSLLLSVALVAVAIGVLSVFNTLLAAVVERMGELSVMRAIGASRAQILGLVTTEALLMTGLGSLGGILLALIAGRVIENLVRRLVPLAPAGSLLYPSVTLLLETVALGAVIGVLGGLYPAWRASRLHPSDALKAE
jgi:putative ABC transport system permease protein